MTLTLTIPHLHPTHPLHPTTPKGPLDSNAIVIPVATPLRNTQGVHDEHVHNLYRQCLVAHSRRDL